MTTTDKPTQPLDQTAQQATGEPQPVSGQRGTCYRCFNDGREAEKRNAHPANFAAGFAVPDAPHTCSRGLGRLDAHGIAELRAILLRVLDDGIDSRPWLLYPPGAVNWRMIDQPAVDAERLDFVEAVVRAVVAAAAPAVGKERR